MIVWCPVCKVKREVREVDAPIFTWGRNGHAKAGQVPFRVGTYVKCSVCSVIFVAVFKEAKEDADTDQGTSVLEGQ